MWEVCIGQDLVKKRWASSALEGGYFFLTMRGVGRSVGGRISGAVSGGVAFPPAALEATIAGAVWAQPVGVPALAELGSRRALVRYWRAAGALGAFLWLVFLALLALVVHSVVVHRVAPLSLCSGLSLAVLIVAHRWRSV